MRGWLMLRHTQLSFEELYISPLEPDYKEKLRAHSPSGKVPALQVGEDLLVWESLAIGEFLNERYPGCELWSFEDRQRAIARALACQMHVGFWQIRERLRHPDVEIWSARAEVEESTIVPGLSVPASVRRRAG